ncbi:MAG TPA: STAS/SEC14 domain-containing protein [Longimicrobiales bacterium]
MPITEPGQPRTRMITHRGVDIMLLDYSDMIDTDASLEEIRKTKELISLQPLGSVRTLTYVAGSRYTAPIIEAMKDLVAHNKPYVRAAALVGMNTLHRIIYRAVVAFSRRNIQVFEDLDAAKDWLSEQ